MSVFTGAGVAIITPFKENGDVDYEKFAENIKFETKSSSDPGSGCIMVIRTSRNRQEEAI